ncbi:MAG: helix-turn-helix domain-containing protein, partial [Acidobacteriota bacterium]
MASFGEELRRERELRDISLKEISEATKISTRFLQALEEDDFAILPGGIFNRGFIRAYARFIGIDGEEMVNAYLHEVSLRQAQQTGPGNARGAPPGQEA